MELELNSGCNLQNSGTQITRFNFLHRTTITGVSQQEETPTGLYKNGQNRLMPMLRGKEILTPCDGACASFRAKRLKISACEAIMSVTTEIQFTDYKCI